MVCQGMQYILAHYKLTDCDCTEPNDLYKMGNSHEEFEVKYIRMCSTINLGYACSSLFVNASIQVHMYVGRCTVHLV